MRRRSSAPGRLRPDGRGSLLVLPILVALVVLACGSAGPTGAPELPSDATQAPASTPPGGSSAGPPSPSNAAPSDSETPAPSEPGQSPAATGSPSIGGAMACAGSDENRDFYASMAAAVGWAVYCPILPDDWFVGDGQYRLAGGGWMQITYEGPADAQLLLRQGFFCETDDGCVPPGQDVDAAPFGDREGRLVAGEDGSWSIVADRGGQPSWLLVVSGLGEADARQIASSLHLVTD
jgi:hypothetical protein